MGRTLIKSFHTTLSDLISCGGIDGSKKKKSKRSALTSEFFTQASVGIQGGHCPLGRGPGAAPPAEREAEPHERSLWQSEQNALGKAMQSGEYSKGKNQKKSFPRLKKKWIDILLPD